MGDFRRCFALLLAVVLLLSGCTMGSVEDMYQLPKRSEGFANLQSEIDRAMAGLEYSAPIRGEHQQIVQMADLNGDGNTEYILFAKGNGERPLQVMIFSGDADGYGLVDTIEFSGAAFEQVEYLRMDNRPGLELVVTLQLSDEVLRSVSVYSMISSEMQQRFTVSCTKYQSCDLNEDGMRELLVLQPGEAESVNGLAELYRFVQGTVTRSAQADMSAPADKIRRIITGKLEDGVNAVFVASDVSGSAIITDVFAEVDHVFTNISFSSESGTGVQTLRNHYVYADDIDSDGIMELPSLLSMNLPGDNAGTAQQHLIRWYSMNSHGQQITKSYSYHNFVGGWYLELDESIASRIAVVQKGNSYEFVVWDEGKTEVSLLMTVYVLTGQKREEQAITENRFVLYRTDSTVYAAKLEVLSGSYNLTKQDLIGDFRLIMQDWKTGET